MNQDLFILTSLPFIIVMISIFVKFIHLCREAREEEFAMREAIAVAQLSGDVTPEGK